MKNKIQFVCSLLFMFSGALIFMRDHIMDALGFSYWRSLSYLYLVGAIVFFVGLIFCIILTMKYVGVKGAYFYNVLNQRSKKKL